MVQNSIVAKFDDIHLVRVGHDFHVVSYDDATDIVKAIYSGDRQKGLYMQTQGFHSDAIRLVSKGRKKETATTYYQAAVRIRKKFNK